MGIDFERLLSGIITCVALPRTIDIAFKAALALLASRTPAILHDSFDLDGMTEQRSSERGGRQGRGNARGVG
jgi:hypothetical protein